MASEWIWQHPSSETIRTMKRSLHSGAITEPGLDKEYPDAVLISEWSNPAVAIPAGFHIDFLLQIGEPAYRILLGPDSRAEGGARTPHAFFERAGGGNIKDFVDNYLKHYTLTKSRGYISMPTGNHDMPRPTWGRDTNKRFAPFLRCY